MFTFGRQHEKACAVRYLRDPQQAELIESVIDAVHDLLEGAATVDTIRPMLLRGLISGGSGVWEQTGSWTRKLIAEQPHLESVWTELAAHADWKVRFRVACFINDMPATLAQDIGAQLVNDRSKKVREMAEARLEEIGS